MSKLNKHWPKSVDFSTELLYISIMLIRNSILIKEIEKCVLMKKPKPTVCFPRYKAASVSLPAKPPSVLASRMSALK
jgi:hypothetical protein